MTAVIAGFPPIFLRAADGTALPSQLEHSGCLASILFAHDMLDEVKIVFVTCDGREEEEYSKQFKNVKKLLE